ncbi:MFS transporter [Dactylosporangium sp. NPDC005572]|uniref:MFS transporter n=1 Tax=Dactylosporangium sp. NPDC005572 TaxID=3156889 RepID=UPI0033B45A52
MATTRRLPIALLFAAVVADGYDTASLSFVTPALSEDWGLRPADLTLPLVATNVGAVLGYLACARLSARFGRAAVVWASVLAFGAATAATAAVTGMPALTAIRFITGLGLGTVLPAAVSLAADLAGPRRREPAAVLLVLGMAVGAVLGGVTGGPLIHGLGWPAVFWVAAALAAVLALLLYRHLPRTDGRIDGGTDERGAEVGALLRPEVRVRTALLWGFAFLVFTVSQTLNTWLPTLLLDYGFTAERAPLGTAVWGLGGIAGGAVLAVAAARLGAPRVLVVLCGLAAAMLAVVSLAPLATPALLGALALAGAGAAAGPAGQSALALGVYDPAAHTTGIAWAVALGRVGSIVGPAVCGALLAAGLPSRAILLLAGVPVLLASVVVAALHRARVPVPVPVPAPASAEGSVR